MKKIILLFGVALLWASCKSEEPEAVCGFCPNNTSCIDDVCGCPPNQFDMGSWCMAKDSNLFVATGVFSSSCFEPFGLLLGDIHPEQNNGGGVLIPNSLFSLRSRENSAVGFSGSYAYYVLPDGDSIDILEFPFPKYMFPYRCQVEEGQICESWFHGKFHGKDTIQVEIDWILCTQPDNKPQSCQFIMTRWR